MPKKNDFKLDVVSVRLVRMLRFIRSTLLTIRRI